jgi:serine-type D-Ala-D-Ala carboxypeptidase/endopeptidase
MFTRSRRDVADDDWPGLNFWNRTGIFRAARKCNSVAEYWEQRSLAGREQSKRREARIMMPKILAALTLSFFCAAGNFASADTPPLAEQVAAIVQPQLDQYPDVSIGVAVGVVQPGNSGAVTTSIFYFGKLADENNNPIPLDGATEFEIGSVTKTFTTTVLAAQIQDQPWLLDLPINRIFPRTPSYQGQQITIRDLADYTSGLPDSNRSDGGSATCTFGGGSITDCYALSLMFQNLTNPTLSGVQFAPGSAYLYSDLAVALLALAEPVLGGSHTTNRLGLLNEWEALVTSVVLEPLRMNSTHAFDPALDPALLPQGFTTNSSGQIMPALNHNESWPAFLGAGGLVSTPSDMMIYLEYNLGLLPTLLNDLLPALHTPATAVKTPHGVQLALGWFITAIPGSTIPMIGKNGGVPSFNTQVFFAPSTGTGVFGLVNTNNTIIDVLKIASQVMQIINGVPPTAAGPIDDQP